MYSGFHCILLLITLSPVICRIIGLEGVDWVESELLDNAEDLETMDNVRGHPVDPAQVEFVPIHPRNLLQSLENPDQLSEWTPIANEIGINETQFYEFVVNTTHLGLGEYYEILVFLSGNICKLPSDLDDIHSPDNQLEVFYSYNQSDLYHIGTGESKISFSVFNNGYMKALASNPTADPYSNLYIAVQSPYTSEDISETWSYELGISQNDLVFQWDDRSWANLVDSDDSSALFITGNLSSDLQLGVNSSDSSIYKLHIYSHKNRNYFEGLNRSWCAIKNGPELIDPNTMEAELTTRYGNIKQQFYVEGLNSSSSYVAYLTQDFSGSGYGGAIFEQFEFETMEDGACKLIYDLSFCSDVAYSVLASDGFLDAANATHYHNKSLLAALYDNHTESLYQNFAKAIQVVNCDDELDARYSPIRTCSDCKTSYKQWLCSVTIPRCSTRNVTGYQYREAGEGRNEFIQEIVVPSEPYFEMLPCVNMCQAIVRDCAPDFGFACPTTNTSIAMSYYWDESEDEGYPTCNYFGSSSSFSQYSSKITATNLASKLVTTSHYKLLVLLLFLHGLVML